MAELNPPSTASALNLRNPDVVEQPRTNAPDPGQVQTLHWRVGNSLHRFQFFHQLNLVVHQYGDRVGDADLLQHLLTVYDHPDFRSAMDVLSSFLNTSDVAVTAGGLREVGQAVSARVGADAPPNLVGVVTRTRLGHGLTRLYAAYADRGGAATVRIFDTFEGAADWLDQARARQPGTTTAAAQPFLTAAESHRP